jgi:hypothetical protein
MIAGFVGLVHTVVFSYNLNPHVLYIGSIWPPSPHNPLAPLSPVAAMCPLPQALPPIYILIQYYTPHKILHFFQYLSCAFYTAMIQGVEPRRAQIAYSLIWPSTLCASLTYN